SSFLAMHFRIAILFKKVLIKPILIFRKNEKNLLYGGSTPNFPTDRTKLKCWKIVLLAKKFFSFHTTTRRRLEFFVSPNATEIFSLRDNHFGLLLTLQNQMAFLFVGLHI
ncbi:MAG: hypothetical protein AABX34_02845, partial [Nanoarchaeota archaeon]